MAAFWASDTLQDLELWLTKEEVPGGFNLVARAGRVVQVINHSICSQSKSRWCR